jgi:hypothetical protein
MKKPLISFLVIILLCVVAFLLRPRVSTAQTGGGSGALVSQVAVSRPVYQTTVTLDSTDSRINLDAGESAAVDLQWSGSSGTIRLLAPNGGSINGQGGKVEIAASQQPSDINFTFLVGTKRGRYTVEVSQGQSTQTLEFWAGPEPPLGQPGPNLTFTGTP